MNKNGSGSGMFSRITQLKKILPVILKLSTDKENILIVFNTCRVLRKVVLDYYSNIGSIEKKSVVACLREIRANFKSLNDLKCILANHSENLEENIKKVIITHKMFAFYRSLILLPTVLLGQQTTLDLSQINIGYDGILVLSNFIRDSKSLVNLFLGYNNLGDEGCSFLKPALAANLSLVNINFECNGITNEGLSSLTAPFIVMKTLKNIKLSLNTITYDGLKEFALKIEKERLGAPFTQLDFKYNNIVMKEDGQDLFKKLKIGV